MSDSSLIESTPTDKNISIGGDVIDSVLIAGDNNTVNQTIIQKFFNNFNSDTETLESRNCRILPLRLVPFFDYCVDLIFLRCVGGGFIFSHCLLMENFSEM